MPGLTEQAAHKDELPHRPAYYFDSLLGNDVIIVQQRHMRRETLLHEIAESGSHHCRAESLLKRHQLSDTVASSQNQRRFM